MYFIVLFFRTKEKQRKNYIYNIYKKEIQRKMGKSVIVLAVLATFVSCGKPSPEEIQVDDCVFEGHTYLVFSQDGEVKSVMHDPICEECANKK